MFGEAGGKLGGDRGQDEGSKEIQAANDKCVGARLFSLPWGDDQLSRAFRGWDDGASRYHT